MSQVVFLSLHCPTGWEYVLTDIIIIRDFIVGPPVLDDVALCRDKSLLLSRSDVSVLDSPSPTDKGWTARWVSVARIQRHHSLSLSLSSSPCFSRGHASRVSPLLFAILRKFQPDKLSLGPSLEYIEYRRRKVERSPVIEHARMRIAMRLWRYRRYVSRKS